MSETPRSIEEAEWAIADDGILNIWFEDRFLPVTVQFYGSERDKQRDFVRARDRAVKAIRALARTHDQGADGLRAALAAIARLRFANPNIASAEEAVDEALRIAEAALSATPEQP